MPQSLATPAFAGFSPIAENGTKAVLTTGMTTDRKNFIFIACRGIMAEIEYPGVVQLIERVVWDHEAASLSLATRTKMNDPAQFEQVHETCKLGGAFCSLKGLI